MTEVVSKSLSILKFFSVFCGLLLLLLPSCVIGHGNMVSPPTWFDAGGAKGMKAKQQCSATAKSLTGFCMWFTNETYNTGATIFNKTLLTYSVDDPKNAQYLNNPWKAPGTAMIYDPCGVAGGNPEGCPKGDATSHDCPGGGFSHGPGALSYYDNFTDVLTTDWKAGSVVEVAWGIKANHGGGYSYRLCSMPADGDYTKLSEKCFNDGHLEFYGETQWVQHGDNKANRTAFKANQTNVGTFPKGSWWRKNPIPACKPMGGDHDKHCLLGTQFPPPAPGLKGFGEVAPLWATEFDFNIVDQLMVPADLTPGKYVLSFRWDCEQTPQVWHTCSNIKIVA